MNFKNTHIIGIGSSGSNMVNYIQNKGIKAKFSYINDKKMSDLEFETNFIEFIPKGELISKSGEEFRISDMSAKLDLPESVNDILKFDKKYILLAGFGGYTGTFVTEEIVKILNKNKIEFSIICSIPFSFEGQRRMRYANELKQKLQNNSGFHCLEYEQLSTKYGDMTIKEAFEKADEELFTIFEKQFKN